jgi:hypothetical protein
VTGDLLFGFHGVPPSTSYHISPSPEISFASDVVGSEMSAADGITDDHLET